MKKVKRPGIRGRVFQVTISRDMFLGPTPPEGMLLSKDHPSWHEAFERFLIEECEKFLQEGPSGGRRSMITFNYLSPDGHIRKGKISALEMKRMHEARDGQHLNTKG